MPTETLDCSCDCGCDYAKYGLGCYPDYMGSEIATRGQLLLTETGGDEVFYYILIPSISFDDLEENGFSFEFATSWGGTKVGTITYDKENEQMVIETDSGRCIGSVDVNPLPMVQINFRGEF